MGMEKVAVIANLDVSAILKNKNNKLTLTPT